MIGYFVSVLRVTNVLLLSMLTDISIKYVFISFMIKKNQCKLFTISEYCKLLMTKETNNHIAIIAKSGSAKSLMRGYLCKIKWPSPNIYSYPFYTSILFKHQELFLYKRTTTQIEEHIFSDFKVGISINVFNAMYVLKGGMHEIRCHITFNSY